MRNPLILAVHANLHPPNLISVLPPLEDAADIDGSGGGWPGCCGCGSAGGTTTTSASWLASLSACDGPASLRILETASLGGVPPYSATRGRVSEKFGLRMQLKFGYL